MSLPRAPNSAGAGLCGEKKVLFIPRNTAVWQPSWTRPPWPRSFLAGFSLRGSTPGLLGALHAKGRGHTATGTHTYRMKRR